MWAAHESGLGRGRNKRAAVDPVAQGKRRANVFAFPVDALAISTWGRATRDVTAARSAHTKEREAAAVHKF
ncbi:hypothetical protein HPB50_010314 [Hyalomma asiaticum]|uniref:Uncharacterized protein n=1 Tax=Hyalomma asiaticum TaxID=266040 RepID=A0ACB7TI93_HYAAI|nr:hypothetical protein HPB50_010314 [Hyalomma asiaticum]